MKTPGEKLKTARLRKGLSLADTAKQSGLTDTIIFRIENGSTKEPSALAIKSLCGLYGLSVDEIFTDYGWLETGTSKNHDFKNVDKLSESEKQHIQQEIDFLCRDKEDEE